MKSMAMSDNIPKAIRNPGDKSNDNTARYTNSKMVKMMVRKR